MADSKRQSTGNRISTPKSGAQGPGDLDASLLKAIGARVKVITSNPPLTLEGTLFVACPVTNQVAISTAPTASSPSHPALSKSTAQAVDYHVIPVSRIQSFTVLALSTANTANDGALSGWDAAFPAIGAVDPSALSSREASSIMKIVERDATRGKGVGREGQEIFDALARTLPARWQDTTIVVNDSVLIAKPYRLEDCSAPGHQGGSLARVKKVLENERKKIADRNRASNKVAVPAPGAKGG